ncbi:MAG: RagB/SusD family nutrient uptake outer membrane protein [Bacteroidota bacterium]
MKKLIYIGIILLLTSCSKFLEPQSQFEYVPRDVNALNELLLGNAYLDPANEGHLVFSYNEVFSDDFAAAADNGNHVNNALRYRNNKPYFAWHPDMFKIGNDNVTFHNVWRSTFQNILGCNAALDYIDKVTGTTDDRNYVKGQALALRAFYYFQLVNLFGEPYNYNKNALGVPLKLNAGLEPEFPSRATVEEVYLQIEKDLAEAELAFLALPKTKQFIKDGRVTLPMIQLMKARAALFMEDYDKVIINANNVLNNWGLSLLDLNSFIQTPAQPYYVFSNYNNPEAMWLFGTSADFNKFTTDLIYLTPTNLTQPRRLFTAAPALVSSYDVDDLRKDNYIFKQSPTISSLQALGKIPVNTAYSYITSEFGRSLRLSEAYVMLAEAYYRKNRAPEAVTTLETLRLKRYKTTSGTAYKVPAASTSGTALLAFIKAERRREMCFEGLRWFDQRRWGMESFSRIWKEDGGITQTFTINKNDPAFTLPIPFDAIDKNPALKQNILSTPKY